MQLVVTADVRPLRAALTLDQALGLIAPSTHLHGLIQELQGHGTPSTARQAETALDTAVKAERAAASPLRSVEARTPRWHELMMVSEAVSRHGSRLEATARTLGAAAA